MEKVFFCEEGRNKIFSFRVEDKDLITICSPSIWNNHKLIIQNHYLKTLKVYNYEENQMNDLIQWLEKEFEGELHKIDIYIDEEYQSTLSELIS